MLSCTLFWDDITKFWDENVLLFTFLTGKLRKKKSWTNKKFVYLNIITNFRPKITSENIIPTTWKGFKCTKKQSVILVHVGFKKILLHEFFYHFFISFFDSFSWTQVGSPREFTPIFVKKHLTKWIASIQYSGFRSQAVRARFEQHISNNVAHLFILFIFLFF